MSVEAEKERLLWALSVITDHLDKIIAETENITEIHRDIMNKLPDARDHIKMGKLTDATMDLGNGAYVIKQGIDATRKVIKEVIPTFTHFR